MTLNLNVSVVIFIYYYDILVPKVIPFNTLTKELTPTSALRDIGVFSCIINPMLR